MHHHYWLLLLLQLIFLSVVSVVVCSRVKLIRAADWTKFCFYMTNTTYTQVYCTGNLSHMTTLCNQSHCMK